MNINASKRGNSLVHTDTSTSTCASPLWLLFSPSWTRNPRINDDLIRIIRRFNIPINYYFLFYLLRSSSGLSEMFPSCSGPDNQWMTRQGDDIQGSYDSGPHPHSWPQFCNPWPSSAVQHSCSQSPYAGTYTRAKTPYWRKHPNTWKVCGPSRLLR